MIGQTISHYRIVSQLGAGGMGVVYAAHDPRLNRQVALKFVPEDLANDTHALDRLRSEARTASGLNHPNICTIYDIGEHDGRPFIVMELLNGITLRDRLATRPLKIHEAVEIGIQVADALYWAHRKDVIHRDIKPANLFQVDQGALKILDFGLAKFVAPQTESETTVAPTIDLTAVGVAVGTVAYMSPEQVSGEPLDRRTDLFSLGVVLYEGVTGQQPFKGKTSAVILASILTQEPTAPIVLNADVPPRLQEVINKCLEKDRELRYQDAAGLRADLRRIKRDLESGSMKTSAILTSGAIDASRRSVAVPALTQSPQASAPGSPETVSAPRNTRGLMLGGGLAVVAVAGLAVMLMNRGSPPAPAPVPESAPASPTVPAAPVVVKPGAADETRARFDEAIVEVNRLLAAGDTNGATRALNTARAIDPGSPVVAELSARLVEHFKADAEQRRDSARRQANGPATPAVRQGPSVSPTEAVGAGGRPDAISQKRPEVAPPTRASGADQVQTPPAVVPQPPPAESTAPKPAPEPAPAAALPASARTEPVPERRTPTAPVTPAEDDDTAIRRVVATYGRAIEGKDLALFRSVKPNMSADEQRRIQEGFRAVTSQHVEITILGIDQRGQDASVRLRRRDVIQAGGRQQSADSQQTMTLIKTGSGWVIREIGR